ncbi:hypothetical protein EU508_01455 [Pseudoalteromonas fuliginea]|uniref:Uncharacterized protein n=1 Tax=Pseudoalteromonas fuliginea TaxID=1872678 RepID=A0AB73BLG3_9GAMM|nr:hypothetical protein [Pseudoalteromonas fuliginea]KAA1164688.1 hypothetical protein EU508_01455 [Pseudoalteromonas fuliginea]
MKKTFVLLLISLLLGCDKEPTLIEMKDNFNKHQATFLELQAIVCEMGKVKQPYSYTESKFVFGPKGKLVKRVPELESLLKLIGVDSVSFERGQYAQCTLKVQYYVRGFAGTGISYDYRYGIENPILLDESKHLIDSEPNRKYSFDIYLSDGWYLSFQAK